MEENSEDNTVLAVTLLTSVVLQKKLIIELDGYLLGEYHNIQKDENREIPGEVLDSQY